MSNDKKPRLLIIAEELENTYDFRYNTVRDITEYKIKKVSDSKEESCYKEITERFINKIVTQFKIGGLRTSYSEIDQLINSEDVDIYNPFIEYFENLPKWDNSMPSEIEKLANTVKTGNQEYFKTCFKKWLIALVACAIKDEIVNQQMIVLSGAQGIGKSTWISNLVPKTLEKYQYSGTVNASSKDTYIHLAETLLINLDELTNMNKKETSRFKEIITQGTINIRKPYARHSKKLIRRASFIGSINESEFLYDLTGSRRFLCFIVDNINYKSKINIDLVYAEAKYLLDKGEKYYFDKEDILKIEKNNSRFRVKSPMEIRLLDKYSPVYLGAKIKGSHFKDTRSFRATDLYRDLFDSEPSGGEASFLGKLLNKHKFEYTFIRGNKYYTLYTIPELI